VFGLYPLPHTTLTREIGRATGAINIKVISRYEMEQ
jgi:hypothetical protein